MSHHPISQANKREQQTQQRWIQQVAGNPRWERFTNKTPQKRERPFWYILNLEASLHSLLSFEWTLIRPANFNLLRQNIVFSYSERIPVSFSWLFHYVSFLCVCVLNYVIINFYKKCFFIIILLYLFSWKLFLFFHVLGCSGMFRHVPECSVFRVLSTPVPDTVAVEPTFVAFF